MLSGKYPEETNHWLPYFYSPQESPIFFKTLNKIGAVFPLDRLPSLRNLAVGQTRRFILKQGVHINNVPFHIIDKVTLYPYYYMHELPFFHELKEQLQKKCQTSLTHIGPPKTRKHLYRSLLKYIRASNHEKELVIAYEDALDGLGHKFGPYSPECLHYAKSLDRVLLEVYQKLAKCFGKNLTFFVFSDHGQCEQTNNLNLLSELDKKTLNLGDDYLCILDATLALFWAKNKDVEEKILEVLGKIRIGKVIDERLQKKYHIRFDDKRYGEIIFVLNPGGTLFPNFFSSFGTMRGLHGYLPEDDVQKGLLISDKKSLYVPRHVRDIRNFIVNVFSQET